MKKRLLLMVLVSLLLAGCRAGEALNDSGYCPGLCASASPLVVVALRKMF